MKRIHAASVALAVAIATVSCDRAPMPDATTAPVVASAKQARLTSFTFTKIPAAVASHAITSPAVGLETIVFQMDAEQADGFVVQQLAFMISGSLQAGDVVHYQLFYYPDGLSKPPVLLGTNEGANWVAPGGAPSSFITFDFAPITIKKKSFTAVFALRADVVGTGTFFFDPRVQTCLVDDGTGARDVAWFGGDLPLQGDTYRVN
jgi:hypothetical protein